MYDAWAAYDPTAVGTRLGGSLRRPAAERTDAYKSQAVSYAAYRALLNLFPARSADFRALMTAMGYDPDDASTDPASPTGVGNQAAAAVLAFRATDGSNQAGGYADTIGYQSGQHPRPGQRPVPLAAAAPPQRQRRHRRPEVPDPALGQRHPVRADLAQPVPPAGPDPADAAAAGRGGHRHPAGQSATLTDLTKVRAEYWADGPDSETPPGHWLLFAGAVCRARGYNLDQSAKLTFALANAELDASIAAWNAKLPLGLRAADHRRPDPHEGQAGAGLGRPLQGHAAHQGRDLASLPGGDLPDPAVPRVRVRPLHLQRRRGQGPAAVHRQRPVRGQGDGPARQLVRRAGGDAAAARRSSPGRPSARPGTRPASPAASAASTSPTPTTTAAPSAPRSARHAWDKAQGFFNGTAGG